MCHVPCLCFVHVSTPSRRCSNQATHAGPSDDGGERDDWLREPDDDVMTQAYFDAKCAGDDGDWGDLTYDNLYY